MSDATKTTIGFVGLGNMGRHMSRRIAEGGCTMFAYDISKDACEEAAGHGMAICGSPKEVADKAEIVLCSLPTPQVMKDVLLGAEGLQAGSTVRIVIDLSTVGPAASAEAAEGLAKRDITLIDAPVSGGTTGAAAGTLAVMVSGPEDAITEVRAVLDLIGSKILFVGTEAGNAQIAKLTNNMLFAANLVSALEAMAYGVKGGLDPRLLLEALNASSGRSYVTETRIGPAVLQRDDAVRFATELLNKDVQLGLAAAEELGARSYMNSAAGEFLLDAVKQGFGPRDYAALIEIFEEWNKVSVEAEPAKDQ